MYRHVCVVDSRRLKEFVERLHRDDAAATLISSSNSLLQAQLLHTLIELTQSITVSGISHQPYCKEMYY